MLRLAFAGLIAAFGVAQTGLWELVASDVDCLVECTSDDAHGDCPSDCETCACSTAPRTAVTTTLVLAGDGRTERALIPAPIEAPRAGVVSRVFRPPRVALTA